MAPDTQAPDAKGAPGAPQAKRPSDFGDILFGLAFILFAVLMFVGAMHFPYRAKMGLITSSAFTPMLLSGLVAILAAVLILITLRKPRGTAAREWFVAVSGSDTTRRALLIIALSAVYILLVGRINFVVVNCLYLLAMFWFLRIGSPARIVLFALANGLFVSLLIPYIFQMPVP